MEIENQEYDQERALYDSHNVIARNCRFDGLADGESAFKESRDIVAEHCYFNLRYPFWHNNDTTIVNCEMTDTCRAAPIVSIKNPVSKTCLLICGLPRPAASQ